jgi:hypothetical protein
MDIGRAGSVLLLVNEMKCFGMRPSLVVTGPLHRVKQTCLTVSSICFQRPGLYFQTKSTTSPLIFVFCVVIQNRIDENQPGEYNIAPSVGRYHLGFHKDDIVFLGFIVLQKIIAVQ